MSICASCAVFFAIVVVVVGALFYFFCFPVVDWRSVGNIETNVLKFFEVFRCCCELWRWMLIISNSRAFKNIICFDWKSQISFFLKFIKCAMCVFAMVCKRIDFKVYTLLLYGHYFVHDSIVYTSFFFYLLLWLIFFSVFDFFDRIETIRKY